MNAEIVQTERSSKGVKTPGEDRQPMVSGPSTRGLVNMAYRTLHFARVLPSPWMMRSPLKIYEYQRVMEGCTVGPNEDLIDLGCGKGLHTQSLARHCRSVVGLDPTAKQIGFAKTFLTSSRVAGKVKFICSTLETSGLKPNSFDKLFSFCVLEHIPNLPEVLRYARTILRPGGELHVSVDSLGPFQNTPLLEKHRKDHFVVQYFTPETIRKTMAAEGFDVTEVFPILTGPIAKSEFEQRIHETHPHAGFMERLRKVRAFDQEDRALKASSGIMLVVRARRSAS